MLGYLNLALKSADDDRGLLRGETVMRDVMLMMASVAPALTRLVSILLASLEIAFS